VAVLSTGMLTFLIQLQECGAMPSLVLLETNWLLPPYAASLCLREVWAVLILYGTLLIFSCPVAHQVFSSTALASASLVLPATFALWRPQCLPFPAPPDVSAPHAPVNQLTALLERTILTPAHVVYLRAVRAAQGPIIPVASLPPAAHCVHQALSTTSLAPTHLRHVRRVE
jgi:hypothetical protein